MGKVLLLALAGACQAQTPAISGVWLGTLNGGGGLELRIALHLQSGLNGLTGKMDSLDQGAKGIAMANVKLEAGEFTFDIPMISGRYKGTLNATRGRIEGTWTQGEAPLPLAFSRVNLTIPAGKKLAPAAVVTGHQAAVLGDHLASNGIAVLQFDGAPDTGAGIAFLKSRAGIDPARIALVECTESGITASMAGAGSEDKLELKGQSALDTVSKWILGR